MIIIIAVVDNNNLSSVQQKIMKERIKKKKKYAKVFHFLICWKAIVKFDRMAPSRCCNQL